MVLLLIASITFGTFRWLRDTPHAESRSMRVAFPYNRSPQEYDPANITLAPEYIFLENTFSPLIELDVHGMVTAGVASRFEWVDNEAQFTIREDLYTIDGHQLSARDAAVSLKRVLILSGNTHGNLQALLCRNKVLRSLAEDCPGIEVRGNLLILKPGSVKPFLFPMLAAIDFAVIPERSIDPSTLAITDFRNTSGPYFVAKDRGQGRITLSANPSHYHYDELMPTEVHLVPTNPKDPKASLSLLERGEVDVVTRVDAVTPEDALRFFADHKAQFNLHATLDIRNILLKFTAKGLHRFSIDERRIIGRQVRERFLASFAESLAYKPTIQFLPTYGEGGLSDTQLESLGKEFESAASSPKLTSGENAVITRLALRDDFQRIFDEVMPGIRLTEGESPEFVDYSKNLEAMPIIQIGGPDTGFLEDIGLVSCSVNAGYLGIPKSERAQWLAEYGNLAEKEDRIVKLNRAHFESLYNAEVIPIAAAPYVSLTTKDWKIHLPKLFANNPLWLYKKT